MRRKLAMAVAAAAVFAAVSVVMVTLLPAPLRAADYMVIGAVATLVSLLALFFMLMSTSLKGQSLFFKRRKPPT